MNNFKEWIMINENNENKETWQNHCYPKNHYVIGDYKDPTTNTLEGIARKFSKLQSIPLIRIFDENGELPEKENINESTNNKRPILVIKESNKLSIIKGKNIAIQCVNELKNSDYTWEQATVEGYIIDMDNPKVRQMMQSAITREQA